MPNRVTACPECDSSAAYERETMDPPWRCQDCGETFDEPIERAVSQRPNPTGSERTPTPVLLADLERVCKIMGRAVTIAEYDQYGNHSAPTLYNRMNWTEAIEQVGFEPVRGARQGLNKRLHQMRPEDAGLSPMGERGD